MRGEKHNVCFQRSLCLMTFPLRRLRTVTAASDSTRCSLVSPAACSSVAMAAREMWRSAGMCAWEPGLERPSLELWCSLSIRLSVRRLSAGTRGGAACVSSEGGAEETPQRVKLRCLPLHMLLYKRYALHVEAPATEARQLLQEGRHEGGPRWGVLSLKVKRPLLLTWTYNMYTLYTLDCDLHQAAGKHGGHCQSRGLSVCRYVCVCLCVWVRVMYRGHTSTTAVSCRRSVSSASLRHDEVTQGHCHRVGAAWWWWRWRTESSSSPHTVT